MQHEQNPSLPTIAMLKAAYPDGIPDSDYFAVLYVLSEKGGMCAEPVARVIAGVKGGTFLRYHYDTSCALPNKSIESHVIHGVSEKLMPHGYANWLKEQEEG